MAFIRGFDVGSTPCPERPGLCLLHGVSDRDRFPPWPLVFSIMRVMGAARRLSDGTRRALERELRGILLTPRCTFENQEGRESVYDFGLGGLKQQICRELELC